MIMTRRKLLTGLGIGAGAGLLCPLKLSAKPKLPMAEAVARFPEFVEKLLDGRTWFTPELNRQETISQSFGGYRVEYENKSYGVDNLGIPIAWTDRDVETFTENDYMLLVKNAMVNHDQLIMRQLVRPSILVTSKHFKYVFTSINIVPISNLRGGPKSLSYVKILNTVFAIVDGAPRDIGWADVQLGWWVEVCE